VGTQVLNGLGHALRWLRERHSKKQYHVADDAGITKGMLSAYETGRQRPSLDTLEKVLNTLGCDLHDLHNALQIVNGRPQIMRQRIVGVADVPEPGRADVRKVLGLSAPLPAEEEKAIAQILDGFHRLIRHLHDTGRKRMTGQGGAPSGMPPAGDDEDDDGRDEGDEGGEES
jgi:transcriptional regulator with XRE-family HTH domain